jgi:hypothetical protein
LTTASPIVVKINNTETEKHNNKSRCSSSTTRRNSNVNSFYSANENNKNSFRNVSVNDNESENAVDVHNNTSLNNLDQVSFASSHNNNNEIMISKLMVSQTRFTNNMHHQKKETVNLFENSNYQNLRLKRNRKAARMLGLLVTAFLICWLPFSVGYL